jgi:uncharacterized protein
MNDSSKAARPRLQVLLAFSAGALFAVGLALAGMTKPDKVMSFLDLTGAWDPSLGFVMLGAVVVYFFANQLALRLGASFAGTRFQLPTRRDIDAKLVGGAALFGVGWGLAGYCPGPGIASLGAGSAAAITFVVAMSIGMLLFAGLQRLRQARNASAAETAKQAPTQHGA